MRFSRMCPSWSLPGWLSFLVAPFHGRLLVLHFVLMFCSSLQSAQEGICFYPVSAWYWLIVSFSYQGSSPHSCKISHILSNMLPCHSLEFQFWKLCWMWISSQSTCYLLFLCISSFFGTKSFFHPSNLKLVTILFGSRISSRFLFSDLF